VQPGAGEDAGGVGVIVLSGAGLALGVATLGTLYTALAAHRTPHGFGSVEYIQMGIVAALALAARALPKFKTGSANEPIIEDRASTNQRRPPPRNRRTS
jgi:hypothetical protein